MQVPTVLVGALGDGRGVLARRRGVDQIETERRPVDLKGVHLDERERVVRLGVDVHAHDLEAGSGVARRRSAGVAEEIQYAHQNGITSFAGCDGSNWAASGPLLAAQDAPTSQTKHAEGNPLAGNSPAWMVSQTSPKAAPTASGVYSASSYGLPSVPFLFMKGTPMSHWTPYLTLTRAAYAANCSGPFGGRLPVFRSTMISLSRTGSRKIRST